MTETNDNNNVLSISQEIEDTIQEIILACGIRPLKEKVSLLYLSIDYIFYNNKELEALFSDEVLIH